MRPPDLLRVLLPFLRIFVVGLLLGGSAGRAAPAARWLAIPAGDAATTLEEFSRQAGVQLVYLLDSVRGQTTRRAEGALPPETVLARMLEGTELVVHRDATGAMAVARRPETRAPRSPPRPAATPPPLGDVVVLPEFTVAGDVVDRYRAADAISAVRVRADLLETPSSISVITRDTIDDVGATRLFDVVRYVAGVQEGRGIQFQDRMILRGFESNGQRTVDNFLQTDDADNIDEAVVDRIEIAKGPNAILSPAGAPGGSINVITKSPLFEPQRSATALVGWYDAQKFSLDLTGPVKSGGRIAYRLIAAVQDSRRYWSADARLRGRVFAPMLTVRLSDRTQATIKLVAAEHWVFREPLLILDPAVTAQTRAPFLAPGLSVRGLNGIQPWSHVGTHTADLFAQITSAVSEHVSLRFAANARYYFEDSVQEFLSTPSLTNRYDPFTGELTQDYVWAPDAATGRYVATYSPFFDPTAIPVRGDRQATRRRLLNLQTDAVARYTFGGVSWQGVAGFALSRRTSDGHGVTGALPGINLTQPDRRADPVWSATPSLDYDSQFTNWQVYLNQRVGLLGDRVLLSGGLLHYDTDTYSRNHLTPNSAARLDDTKNMWMASVLVKPRRNVAVYYSHSTNSSAVIANDSPLWRDGVQDEIGWKSEFFHQRLAVTAAWFAIAQTRVNIPNPARQTDPSAPEQLVSDLENHGLELELTGGLSTNLSAIATFTQLRMRDSLGRPVRAVADQVAGLLLNYRFHTDRRGGLSLYAGASYAGRRAGDTPINFTPLNAVGRTSFFLEPYWVTMVGASYRWREKYLLRLAIDNVLDEHGYIQQAGSRVSGTGITTAPGINVKFSTTVSF